MDEQDYLSILSHPDPDPDALPAELPKALEIEEAQACHLARAIVRLETSLDRQEAAAKKDAEAWRHHLAALQTRAETLRILLKDWMLRKGVPKLASPFVTASVTKARTKLVVDAEGAAIAICKQIGATAAIEIREHLVKKEFDPIFQAQPKLFQGIAHEETGGPGLMIRAKE